MTPDPWAPAREAVFNILRAWVKQEDSQVSAEECLKIMLEMNKTEGAPFIFVAELARVFSETIARYMTALNEELPSREEVMAEIDVLELEYIEETVLVEHEDDTSAST